MTKLKVSLLAHSNANETIFRTGKEKIQSLIGENKIQFVDSNPDVLYFLTGGSEQSAIPLLNIHRSYVLLSHTDDNSTAAAIEVLAYLNKQKIDAKLLNIDDPQTIRYFEYSLQILDGINHLKGRKIGLIGSVSNWLIASNIQSNILESKLGILIKTIPWSELPKLDSFPLLSKFTNTFSPALNDDIEKAAKVYSLLVQAVNDFELDALAVECFSLLQSQQVSGCLALAKFNEDQLPAACEGDIASVTGMMLVQTIIGKIPWMANTVKIDPEKVLFAHCTISPALVSDFTILTHFETNIGTAIQGDFSNDEITIFRLDDTLENCFIAYGTVFNRPQYRTACRTQIEVKFPSEALEIFKTKPLGNHHLIIPGNHLEILKQTCDYLNINIVS